MREKLLVGVLASGTGSNFRAIAEACARGDVPAEVVALVSNKEAAGALSLAKGFGVPAHFVSPKGLTREEHERRIADVLDAAGVGLVCLAGYMRLLTPWFVQHYAGRLVNVHPALLPAFPGVHAQKQAFDYGVRVAGCTTHFVTEEMDAGPVILQAAVPVLPDDSEDSLAQRILTEEHRIYPETVRLFAEGRLRIEGRKVVIEGARADGDQRLKWSTR